MGRVALMVECCYGYIYLFCSLSLLSVSEALLCSVVVVVSGWQSDSVIHHIALDSVTGIPR